MNSMTGFGRAEIEENGHKFAVEIKTVNHRFLDMNLRMPRFLLFLEDSVRAAVKDRLARGRVELFVNYSCTKERERAVKVDMSLVKGYLAAAGEILAAADVTNDLTVTALMEMRDVVTFEEEKDDEEEIKAVLLKAVHTALDDLIAARRREGETISQDMLARAAGLLEILGTIEAREPLVVEEYKGKLRNRLEEFLAETDIDENRFNAEILYFADRSSITEEIVRIKSHVAQLKDTLQGDEASGRNLDFLIQELNREFNTIGSKSSDVDITKAVLKAKGEVEKIREQVQNIE